MLQNKSYTYGNPSIPSNFEDIGHFTQLVRHMHGPALRTACSAAASAAAAALPPFMAAARHVALHAMPTGGCRAS